MGVCLCVCVFACLYIFVPLLLPSFTLQVFNELFKEAMTEADVLAKSQEFEAIKVKTLQCLDCYHIGCPHLLYMYVG